MSWALFWQGKGGETSASPLRRAFRSLSPAFFSLFGLSVFINILVFVPPIYLLQVHERVFNSRSYGTLLFLTLIAVFLIAVSAALIWARMEICRRASESLLNQIEEPVFRASQMGVKPEYSVDRGTADLSALGNGIRGPLIPAAMDVSLLPLFIFVLYLIDPSFALLGAGIVLLLAGLLIGNKIINQVVSKRVETAQVDSLQFSQHLSRHNEVARSMGMIPGLAREWKAKQFMLRGWNAVAARRTDAVLAVIRWIRSVQLVAVVGLGAVLYIQGAITAGQSFAAFIILMRAVGPIEAVVAGWQGFTAARRAFHRMDDLLAAVPDPQQSVSPPDPVGRLAVQEAWFVEPKTKSAIVRDASFDLEPGKMLGVIGPSGAGKSTLLKGLAGAWLPARGKVTLDGHKYSHWHPDVLGRFIGYLPQETELFPGTVAQNIARFDIGAELDSNDLFDAVGLAEIEDLIGQLPEGYNTVVGPGGYQLSGGQRQRVAYARALYGRPRLILLDEPYSALDSINEARLIHSMKEVVTRGASVVVVTHKMSVLQHCDMVLVMNAGYVQAFGPRQQILQRLPGPDRTPLQIVQT